MEYAKPVMKLTELQKMGFTKDYLMSVYHDKRQNFAWKMNMTARSSPILFDTAEFEKFRVKQIELEKKAMHRGMRMVM